MTGAFNPNQTSFTQGYVLCTPQGTLLGHSYRVTEEEAIAAIFTNEEFRAQFWEEARAEGWSTQFVYARIFTPVFFATSALATIEVGAKAGAA